MRKSPYQIRMPDDIKRLREQRMEQMDKEMRTKHIGPMPNCPHCHVSKAVTCLSIGRDDKTQNQYFCKNCGKNFDGFEAYPDS
jgi:transposase-like protein